MTVKSNNSKPSVSVIIPFYAEAGWLKEAVDSALAQDYENCEIIVVNDGSPEDVKDFVMAYADQIRYCVKGNGGPASARNYGIEAAGGAYIAFLDSDDLWFPEKLSRQIAKMEEYSAEWSYTDYETFGENIPAKEKAMTKERKEGLYRHFSPYIGTPTVIVKKDFLDRCGLRFHEDFRYGQDALLWEQINYNAPALYIPEVLTGVRMRGGNAGKRAAVQIHARVKIYDECAATIPGYKKSRSLLYRFAMALCRFGGLFVNEKKAESNFVELTARVLFTLPYLLFKLDRKFSKPIAHVDPGRVSHERKES